jgi:hypothetical protein
VGLLLGSKTRLSGELKRVRLKMGWKTINGRSYFYKSERDGGRVKTTYFGGGESGLLISLLDAEDREIREAERKQRKAEREKSALEEKSIGG